MRGSSQEDIPNICKAEELVLGYLWYLDMFFVIVNPNLGKATSERNALTAAVPAISRTPMVYQAPQS